MIFQEWLFLGERPQRGAFLFAHSGLLVHRIIDSRCL